MLRRFSAWAAVAVVVAFVIAEGTLLNVRIRDFDEGVYWQSIRALARGEPLFSSVFASQPPGFYYLLLPLYAITRAFPSLRLTVLILGVVGLGATYLIARLIAGPVAGLVAAILTAASPLYFHQSAIVQADGPSLALSAVSVAFALLAVREAGRKGLLLAAFSGCFLALSTGLKLQGAVAVLPVALILWRDRDRRTALALTAVLGVLVASAIVFVPAISAPSAAFNDLVESHLRAGRLAPQTLADNLQLLFLRRDVPIEGLALIGAVVAIVVRDSRIIMPLGWALASIVAILAYHPLFAHHVAMLSVPLAVVVSIGLTSIGGYGVPAVGTAAALLVATVGASSAATLGDVQLSFLPDRHDAEMTAAVSSASESGEFWISDNPFAVAAADRDIPGPLVDTSTQRIRSGLLTVSDLERVRRKYGVRWLLEDSFRLDKVPGYRRWLGQHYHPVENLGGRAVVYEANS